MFLSFTIRHNKTIFNLMSGDSGHDCVQLFVSKVKVKCVILAPLVATNGIARQNC